LNNKAKKAFTLIEIMVVLSIIVLMTTIISPRLFRLFKKKDQGNINTVLREFNNLVTIIRQEAVEKQKICRLSFKISKTVQDRDIITMQIMQKDKDNENKFNPEKIYSEYLKTEYILPVNIKIEAVYNGKQNLLEENKGEAFCYISKDGLVQDILIYIAKINEDLKDKYSFKVDPFLGEFIMTQGYLKPEK